MSLRNNFESLYKKILEDFNVYPSHQTAPSTGPDIGMTSGDQQNTFPSKMEQIKIKVKRKKINQHFLKKNARR